MVGNTLVQSWLIWATFHTFFHQKFPLLSSDLKNVPKKDFPMQLFANVLQIRCYCKFPDNHKKYLCWSRFLIRVLIKLQDCNFIKKETPTQVFSCECLKMFVKNFLWNNYGGCFWEWFWRISKGGLTWNDLYD